MKSPKQPFILFFLAGMVPTPAELVEAGKIRGRVGHRNASVVNAGDVPEPCDGVAGKVPEPYKKMPTAAQAIAAYDKRLEDAAKTAASLVDKPPTVKPASAGGGLPAPKGFENLPGGDGAPLVPAADAGVAGEQKSAAPAPTAPAPPPPAGEAGKPPAWPTGKTGK
jgi:hypothetical protein